MYTLIKFACQQISPIHGKGVKVQLCSIVKSLDSIPHCCFQLPQASSDVSETLPVLPERSSASPLSPSSPPSSFPLSPSALSPTSTLKKQSFSIDEANTEVSS